MGLPVGLASCRDAVDDPECDPKQASVLERSDSMEILLFFAGALWAFAPALIEFLLIALGVTNGVIPT